MFIPLLPVCFFSLIEQQLASYNHNIFNLYEAILALFPMRLNLLDINNQLLITS